jgi:hypothetical protein
MKFIFQIILVCISFTIFAQSAGPDQFGCAGGTMPIGEGSLCPSCCAKWRRVGSGTGGITNSNSLMTTATVPGTYEVSIISASGDLLSNDQVTLSTATLEIQIYDPKMTSSTNTYSLVPNIDKFAIGAQTFVNYDSDDEDSEFDLNDTDITGGDDEFIQISIFFKSGIPMASSPPIFALKETENQAGSVRYWLSDDKKKGEYFVGNPIPNPQIVTDGYTVNLWVEGTKGHTKQRATKLYAETLGGSLCKSDPVCITVLDVLEMTWSGIGNGYTQDGKCNSNVLDKTTYHQTGGLANYRAFVDAETHESNVSRLKVYFTLKYTTTPVKAFRQFIQVLDIDDPDPNLVADVANIVYQGLDPNDGNQPNGFYNGIPNKLAYTKDNDNRGQEMKAGSFDIAGQLSKIGPFLYEDIHRASIHSSVFTLNDRPGDNFRVAVFPDLHFTSKLRNQDRFDGLKITLPNNSCSLGDCPEISTSICSPIITSWRTLHIEFDRMAPGTWDDNLQVKGAITDFRSIRLSQADEATIDQVLNKFDSSPISPTGNDFTYGRFQNGKVFLGNPLIQSSSATFVQPRGSGERRLFFRSTGVDLTFGGTLYATFSKSGAKRTHQVIEIINLPDEYVIYLKDPHVSNFSYLAGYDIQFANGVNIATGVISASFDFVKIAKNSLSIPVTIRDDDDDPLSTLPMAVPSSIAEIYGQAFINTDFSEEFVQPFKFLPNMPSTPYEKIGTSFVSLVKDKLKFCGSCLVEKDNFWAAYITDQWQYVDWHDWDSFSESSDLIKLLPPKQALSCPLGRSLGYASNQNMDVGGDISIIFNQTHSDGLMNSIDKFYTVAHEIGHQFGLEDHNAWRPIPNTGLMSAALNVDTPSTDLYFVPWHLNLLRLRSSSPGK